MRSVCIATIAASLVFSPLAMAEPLAPGKPAGVQAARNGASTGLLIVGGIAVAAIVAVVAFGSNSSNANAGVVTSGNSASTTS